MTTELLFNEQLQILLLSLVPGLPLAAALALLVRPLRKVALKLAPWSAVPALAVALFLGPGIDLEVAWFFMGGRMGLDLVGRNFLLLAALVWLLSAFFGQGYLAHDQRRYRFYFFFLLCMGFNFGLILARDMLGFYLFFSLMSFCAYGLVVHTRSREALRAGRVYIILVMLGEVLLLSGMLVMAGDLTDLELTTIAGSRPDSLGLLLLLVGFGIKAGALPLHVWLPLAHPVAPAPASAVLSGVMIKAGLLGWLRFLPTSLDTAMPGWGMAFVGIGFLAAFYGVAVGLCQQDPKTVLAYSSISQMGVMTAIVGCGLLAPQLWLPVTGAVCLYALHHGLAKGSLFLGAGVAKLRPASGSSRWWPGALLLLPCLALAGFPLTGGAIAKLAVKEMSHGLPPGWMKLFALLLPLSAVATTMLLYHFLARILQSSGGDGRICPPPMITAWIVSVLLGGGILWVWPPGESGAFSPLAPAILWQGLWPVALGCALMVCIGRIREGKKRCTLPAGDMLWLFSGRSFGAAGLWRRSREKMRMAEAAAGWWSPVDPWAILDRGRQVEKKLLRWSVVGFCYLLLCFVLLSLLLRM
ncbi:MAG: complex I subunit 5 family protein [Proteobacteria bacterium]|nr:complex I subunit 5 family protein [Pseudomonadota bacterium]MBU1738540.1 complex I subunit 5 family protein [Pseudomonadota bacterium]